MAVGSMKSWNPASLLLQIYHDAILGRAGSWHNPNKFVIAAYLPLISKSMSFSSPYIHISHICPHILYQLLHPYIQLPIHNTHPSYIITYPFSLFSTPSILK